MKIKMPISVMSVYPLKAVKPKALRCNAAFIAMLFLMFSGSAAAADDYTVELYETYCKACHSAAGAGVPVAFNEADWEKKMSQGLDVLVMSAINGKGNMPAQGLCQECTYEDFEALIEYMSKAK